MAYPKLTDKPGALETAAAIRAGELSPYEAVDAAIVRIEELDVHVNALAVGDFERAVAAAHALDGVKPREDQPLFGVPMTVKESFDIAGLPTCWGHPQFRDSIAKRDSKIVTQLKRAGAIIVGKTNVPVDLSDWQSFNPVYGRTNNPHDHARSPGGSSGGGAAAVASGMVPCEYGSDIGGSVRVPAHFCGIWGHKTSWGLVSKHGHDHPAMAGKDAHDGALSIAGPLARNAADIEILLRITANLPLREARKPLSECRLLMLLDYPGSPIDDSVRGPLEAAAKALESAGVRIDRTSELLPDLARQQADYLRMLNIAMARGAPAPDGTRATATDWFNLLDMQARNELAWEALFESYDFVLAPPAPVLAVRHSDEAVFRGTLTINGEEQPAANGLAWAGIATFPNLPSTVLPVGQSEVDGSTLPCGMQVIGPRWSDLGCIAAARGIDAVLNA
ncbi:amidase family protein [Altererythrobacter sp.]|uniref:amidase family protein n=1 Tax=Altererythrobacter sp. TaxID=1872480 RepID=UPI003D09097B